MDSLPADLVRTIRSRVTDQTPPPLLLELDLSRGLVEAPPSSPVQAARTRHVPVLRQVVEGLAQGATDPRVVGLVAHLGPVQPSLAMAGELRTAVRRFRASGKPAICWTESFGEMGPGNVPYYLATGFDEIWLQPSGDVGLTGVVASSLFVRDALDRAGVSPEIAQRHEYKTAADVFMRSGMTEAHREMAERLTASAMESIVDAVSEGRGLSPNAVRETVERAPVPAEEALSLALVDRLGYREDVYAAMLAEFPDARLRYVERYRRSFGSGPVRRFATTGRRPVVAVIQASGPIHLGRPRGASPLSGPSIGSEALCANLRAARKDESVRAVVLRVDSPGGSYVASDAVRHEVLQVRRTGRPVVASMGSVAASGGYYIAMPADVVVANEGTLTGSIGVLAGKQVIRDALQRFGVRVESVSVGRQAEMFSTQRGFTDDEWQRLQTWLDRVYADFTDKAAHDRSLPVDRLREVAKGRVWTGADARRHSLVDQLGGLDDAIDIACARAGLRRTSVDVRPLPKSPLLRGLRPAQSSDSPAAASAGWLGGSALLGHALLDHALPDHARLGQGLLAQALRALQLPEYGVLTVPVLWDVR
ncbi:MAG: signal peptide peptidase SppA [Nocardioidaceae bacterium]